jgi:hypothetical protein
LRTKKFSVLQAEEALERYLLLRQTYAPAFRTLDYTDHTMNELISNGYVLNVLWNVVLVACQKPSVNADALSKISVQIYVVQSLQNGN